MTRNLDEILEAAADLRQKAAEALAENKVVRADDLEGAAERLEREAEQIRREQEATAINVIKKMPEPFRHEAKKGYYKCNTGMLTW